MTTLSNAQTLAKGIDIPDEPIRNSKDRFAQIGIELFLEYGFKAVGVDTVISAAGLTKTTFYNHFDSKDALVMAALERRGRWQGRYFDQAVSILSDGTPRGDVLAHFDAMDMFFNSETSYKCLFILACSEFPSESDPVHITAQAQYTCVKMRIEDILRKGSVNEPSALAEQLMLLLTGSGTTRMLCGQRDAVRRIKPLAEMALDAAGLKA